MDLGKSTPLSSFKSKKPLHSLVPSDQKAGKVSEADRSPWRVKTPGKAVDPPRRSRQTGAALSIKEIREAALKLRQGGSKRRDEADKALGSEKEKIAKVERKSVDSERKLPEKYELLNELFNNLDSSIRLLQMKGFATTFTNIKPRIETLSGRKFTYSHLAKLRFIMPEAILLEIVSQRDEETGNKKADLLIKLSFEVIKNKRKSKSYDEHLQLRKLFRDRVLDFFKSHLEEDEVPEEALPEPFNRSKKQTGAKSHSELPLKPSGSEECSSYQGSSSCIIVSSSLPETPLKCSISIKDEDQCSLLRTPADLASTPAKLTIATPMLQPPKRRYTSPDDNSSKSPSKLLRRPPPNRPLKFDTPVKSGTRNASANNEIFDILPEALIQSIREQEMLQSIEQDPAISQAKWRRQMIAKLPKIFDLIHSLFHSIGRSVLPKEELIHKIILGQLDITERREVEEQLRLLLELAPEWIYEKSALSGDLIVCVNKVPSPEAIRTRLYKAK